MVVWIISCSTSKICQMAGHQTFRTPCKPPAKQKKDKKAECVNSMNKWIYSNVILLLHDIKCLMVMVSVNVFVSYYLWILLLSAKTPQLLPSNCALILFSLFPCFVSFNSCSKINIWSINADSFYIFTSNLLFHNRRFLRRLWLLYSSWIR